jgi:secreted trypsin-like serine protease
MKIRCFRFSLLTLVFAMACQSQNVKSLSNPNVYIGDVGSEVHDSRDPVYRSTVALMATKPDGSTQVFCSGTIIDMYYVLTAAHCIDSIYSGTKMEIGFGTHPSRNLRRKVTRIAFPDK